MKGLFKRFWSKDATDAAMTFEMGLEAEEHGDLDKAFEIWHLLSEQGDARSQFQMGCGYYGFIECPFDVDQRKGFDLFEASATQGNADAMHALGVLFQETYDDEIIYPDADKAVSDQWLLKAANAGSVKSMTELGISFLKGENDNLDQEHARKFLEEAHRKGDAKATNALGIYTEQYAASDTAFDYYESAAQSGYGNAFTNIVRLIKNEKYTDEKIENVKNLALSAIENKFTDEYYGAFSVLEVLAEDPYSIDEAMNVLGEREVASAKYTLLKLKTGHFAPSPDAEESLWQNIHPISNIVDQMSDEQSKFIQADIQDFDRSIAAAEGYFFAASKAGNKSAKLNLIMMHRLQLIKTLTNQELLVLAESAASSNDREACLQYAIYLDQEHPSSVEAFRAFQKASDLGDAVASFEIARRYDFGHGVSRNSQAAVEYYKKSIRDNAEINNATILANFNLGQCYLSGEGVTQSLDEAFMRINFADMLSDDFGSLDPNVKDAIRVVLDKIKDELGEQRVEMLDNSKKNYKEFID